MMLFVLGRVILWKMRIISIMYWNMVLKQIIYEVYIDDILVDVWLFFFLLRDKIFCFFLFILNFFFIEFGQDVYMI